MKALDFTPLFNTECSHCKLNNEANVPFCIRCQSDLRFSGWNMRCRGTCIYCRKDCDLTAEHIFGKWIFKKYPRFGDFSHELRRPNEIFKNPSSPMVSRIQRTRARYEAVVFNVCVECNGGWMSTLHRAAQPIISELASGIWRRFSSEECLLLGCWITMVSINLQCLGRHLIASDEARQQLMNGNIPDGWRIQLAPCVDPGWGGNQVTDTAYLQFHSGFVPFASTFFCIENMWFHTLSSSSNETLDIDMRNTIGYSIGDQIPKFCQISPNYDFGLTKDLIAHDVWSILHEQDWMMGRARRA